MPEPPPTPLWLDCDPGHDDAFAILLAAHHPSLHLLGVSTVHGNAPLSKTTLNALSFLQAIGREDIKVYPGAATPFCREPQYAGNIHGVTGLDGTSLLPNPVRKPESGTALLAIRDAILGTKKDTAWLVATGALTNIGLLFRAFPEVVDWIKGLSIMGGAIGNGFTDAQQGSVAGETRIGNVTKWAEFNILCDPESAQSVFSNSILAAKITLIPLDITHYVLSTQPVLDQVLHGPSVRREGEQPSTIRRLLHDLLIFFRSTYADVFGLTSGAPLHDPVAVAILLHEMAITGLNFEFGPHDAERWNVSVRTAGEDLGRIIISKATSSGVKIPRNLNVGTFWKILDESIRRAELTTEH